MSKTRKDGSHLRREPREEVARLKIGPGRQETHRLLHRLESKSLDELDEDFDEFPSFEKM